MSTRVQPASVMLTWARRHGIDHKCAKPLVFDVPVTRYTTEADMAAHRALSESDLSEDNRTEARRRLAIWTLAGDAYQSRWQDGARSDARRCIALLRRSWWAHCAQKPDLARAEFAEAREAWLHITQAPLMVAGAEAHLAKIRAVNHGKRGGGERDPNGYHDDWLRLFRLYKKEHPRWSANQIYIAISLVWRGKNKADARTKGAICKGINEALKSEEAGVLRHRIR